MASKKQQRNGHAFHPIMGKGGPHEKTNKAKRKADKQQTNQKVREWLARSLQTITFYKNQSDNFYISM